MVSGNKRIGLVLASIHAGSARNVWPSFVQSAINEDKSLFIFPGGRLNARADWENLRNSVYSLVNSENLDGCIAWNSTVRYTESEEEFRRFHSLFNSIPYVTLGTKIPGHPYVDFDAYTGMKMLTSHCINTHGADKIAFLRGPEWHDSAKLRFRGFLDALKDAGLNANPDNPLVTDPFDWNCGDAAAAQLFEDRKLKPAGDFQVLIGSSDMMILAAITYFSKLGYRVPEDYLALGFNNSVESRLAETLISTVHIPYNALGRESFSVMLSLLGKEKKNVKDIVLPALPVIRESCGCRAPRFMPVPHNDAAGGSRRKKSAEDSLTAAITDYLKLNPRESRKMVRPLVAALYGIVYAGKPDDSSRAGFFKLLEKVLARYFNSWRDTELLFGLMEGLSGSGLEESRVIKELEGDIYRLIFKVRERLSIQLRYERQGWHKALNSLKCELLGTRERDSLVYSLARHLPKIGITTAGITLYVDDKTSVWLGGFSPAGISQLRDYSFSAKRITPEALKPLFSKGIFMVQPLFIENQSLGYFVHTAPVNDGVILEELRSAVSYALNGIFQLEELIKAKRKAEQAERTKTGFIMALESELYDPLSGIKEKIENLGKKAAANRALLKELEPLKSFILSQEKKTESLIDMTLYRIGELELKKTLFDPEELLPEIALSKKVPAFPLLLGDSTRLLHCFSFIREEYSGEISASIAYEGLVLGFKASASVNGRKSDEKRSQRLFLAEKIVDLHGGSFNRSKSLCQVTLPWPTLTGKENARRVRGRQEQILVFSDPPLPPNLFGLPVVEEPEKTVGLSGRTAFIAWNSNGNNPELLLKIASLRHRSEFTETAFLCYGKELIEKDSIINGIDMLIRSPKRGTILFIGGRESRTPFLETVGDEIYIPSISLFNETVAKINPGLIIFNFVSAEGAAVVRRHPITVTVPIIMISPQIDSEKDIANLCQYSRLIVCHRSVASSPEFHAKVLALLSGDEILPPHTGALVKKTIHYLDLYAESPISRWKMAEAVNVSEDYLTRIFHREMGLSLWDYLNRFRIYMALELIHSTDDTIQEIAYRSGFQDQAYFCRVFKKIFGTSPGQARKRNSPA